MKIVPKLGELPTRPMPSNTCHEHTYQNDFAHKLCPPPCTQLHSLSILHIIQNVAGTITKQIRSHIKHVMPFYKCKFKATLIRMFTGEGWLECWTYWGRYHCCSESKASLEKYSTVPVNGCLQTAHVESDGAHFTHGTRWPQGKNTTVRSSMKHLADVCIIHYFLFWGQSWRTAKQTIIQYLHYVRIILPNSQTHLNLSTMSQFLYFSKNSQMQLSTEQFHTYSLSVISCLAGN
jgi:hypothetical protein